MVFTDVSSDVHIFMQVILSFSSTASIFGVTDISYLFIYLTRLILFLDMPLSISLVGSLEFYHLKAVDLQSVSALGEFPPMFFYLATPTVG